MNNAIWRRHRWSEEGILAKPLFYEGSPNFAERYLLQRVPGLPRRSLVGARRRLHRAFEFDDGALLWRQACHRRN